jgi:hypothetical protein
MKLISIAIAGLTGATLWELSRQVRRRMQPLRDERKPVPVQTWEGEGGALPTTGAQLGPDPVVPAATEEPAATAGPASCIELNDASSRPSPG